MDIFLPIGKNWRSLRALGDTQLDLMKGHCTLGLDRIKRWIKFLTKEHKFRLNKVNHLFLKWQETQYQLMPEEDLSNFMRHRSYEEKIFKIIKEKRTGRQAISLVIWRPTSNDKTVFMNAWWRQKAKEKELRVDLD